MTDNKLTDNLSNNSPISSNSLSDSEIVKALETAIKIGDAPIGENFACTISKLVAKEAVDHINSLQAENEELKSAINGFRGYDEIIKAEAYKECIEKVKEELKNIAKIEWQDNYYYYLVGTAFFDNLLKELVGEEK